MNKDSKIYVAGHRGLVGSAICRQLKARGYSNIIGRSHAELDLLNAAAVSAFFKHEQPEYVILAAAQVGGIVANNTYRADFIFNNLQIQQNVIGESYKCGVKKLLFLGSTCIYPRDAKQPMAETELLTGPLELTNEPYALAKIAGLKMCESFNVQYGTNYIAVMPTNLYGPHDNFDLERSHVLPAMMRKLHLASALMQGDWGSIRADLKRLPIGTTNHESSESQITATLAGFGVYPDHVELWGTGQPMREFLWSEDMADACIHLMENTEFTDLQKASADGRNFHVNIGTGLEISIAQLAYTIQKSLGYQGEIRFDSSKPDGTMRKLTDVSLLQRLGWKYSVSLEEGIERMYQWYKQA